MVGPFRNIGGQFSHDHPSRQCEVGCGFPVSIERSGDMHAIVRAILCADELRYRKPNSLAPLVESVQGAWRGCV
jgi:hypothetical protein